MSTLIANIKQAFNAHPREIGESYGSHLIYTIRTSTLFLGLSLAIIIHGLFPFLFTHTASDQIAKLSKTMAARSAKFQQED